MKRQVLLFLLLTTLISSLFITAVSATTLVKLDFQEIVSRAQTIISGKVINLENKVHTRNGKKIPYTYITISVNDKLKGNSGSDIYTFKYEGGVIPEEEIRLTIGGMPEFEVGQEVFLFLNNDDSLVSPIVGFSQGRFSIVTDKKSGIKYIYNNAGEPVTESFIFNDKTKDGQNPVNYEYFKNQIKSEIK
ncbi:MAG: hypothetical protein ACLFQV_08350 [Vulcanimicrobiota bacterium]